MLLEIILALLLGCLIGTFTGLTPGIHINLIGALLISLSTGLLSGINPIYLVVFIVAMAITHTFLDFIPSVFLGCPDTDTELSVLPGHHLLKKGQGYNAVLLTNYGSLAAIFILIVIAFPSIFIIEKIYGFIFKLIPYLLIAVSLFLILSEKRKISALLAFSLTGFLGLSVLNMGIKEPLLPLLTGLFGSSMLLLTIKTKTQIPKQEIKKQEKPKMFKPLIGAFIASPICSFLPGLGSGQAAIIGNQISKTDTKGFLVLLGATNTLVMGFSFIALYSVSRARTGATTAIQQIIGQLQTNTLVLIIIVSALTGIFSFFLTIFAAKFFVKQFQKISYTVLALATLGVLILIVTIFSGFFGLLVFAIATFTGIYCISLGVRRTNLMGCLLLPTIIFYLF